MMETFVNVGVVIVAVLHIYFAVIEVFFWKKPLGLKIFRIDPEFALKSAALAANQGVYNCFLSAGLIWSLLIGDASQAFQTKIFFLSCVVVAGVFAGITVSVRILIVQALPAVLTLFLLYFSR